MSTTSTAAQAQFHYAVAQVLGPLLKSRGYRKSGTLFRLYDPSGWGKLLAVQKSAGNDRHRVRFRLNLGVYLPETEWALRRQAPTAPAQFSETLCVVRTSVGRLDGSGLDRWYEANEHTRPKELHEQVARDLTTFVLPFLDQFTSRHAVLEHLLHTRAKDSLFEAIETVFRCGYRTEAFAWLADERANATSTGQRQALSGLQHRLQDLQVGEAQPTPVP